MRNLIVGVVGVAVGAGLLVNSPKVNAAIVEWSGNGHFYEAFIVPEGITWTDARAAAIAAGGDLATITSPQENEFVFGLINDPAYWTHPGGWYGPWLGGFQTPQSAVPIQDPAADWNWVTGEPWGDFVTWTDLEPDDSSGLEENRLFYDAPYYASAWASTWGDKIDGGSANLLPISYVVETNAVPEPTSLAIWGMGAACLAGYACRKTRCRVGVPVLRRLWRRSRR